MYIRRYPTDCGILCLHELRQGGAAYAAGFNRSEKRRNARGGRAPSGGEEARKQEEMRLRARVEELEGILQDDGRTLKELREVQAELTALQDRLGIRDRRICLKL